MLTELRDIENIPRKTASQVKHQWADVVRLVHEEGSVAITHHANVDMVLVDARTYRKLTQMKKMDKKCNIRNQGALDDYIARFEEGIKMLNGPDGRRRVEAVFDARGTFTGKRPIAGSSF